jgi:predicted Fe-S protein YdhL (DUF1289 family)
MTDMPTSPCIGVCRINTRAGYCEGCYRTLQEITEWTQMRLEQKRKVLELLPQRRVEIGCAR